MCLEVVWLIPANMSSLTHFHFVNCNRPIAEKTVYSVCCAKAINFLMDSQMFPWSIHFTLDNEGVGMKHFVR
jgi:hypothetical protein